MSSSDAIAAAGLSQIVAFPSSPWSGLAADRVQFIRGTLPLVGGARPLLSSGAQLRLGHAVIWIPAPQEVGDATRGLAPIYLHSGRRHVLPFIRLVTLTRTQRGTGTQGGSRLSGASYLALEQWALDACTRWR